MGGVVTGILMISIASKGEGYSYGSQERRLNLYSRRPHRRPTAAQVKGNEKARHGNSGCRFAILHEQTSAKEVDQAVTQIQITLGRVLLIRVQAGQKILEALFCKDSTRTVRMPRNHNQLLIVAALSPLATAHTTAPTACGIYKNVREADGTPLPQEDGRHPA
jgi:hypothetical protein